MLVLASLVILTIMVEEFASNSHVAYQLAASERDRLKAYYLAKSALNLVKMEIKLEKQLRIQFGAMLANAGQTGITSDPFCKQMPLSTGLLKGLVSGSFLSGLGKGGVGGSADTAEKGTALGGGGAGGGSTEKKTVEKEDMAPGAQEFLDFDGDFEAVCDPEEKKINLNIFRADPMAQPGAPPGAGTPSRGPSPGTPSSPSAITSSLSPYDEQKNLLFALMSQKDFEPIFKGKPDDIKKVVNAIADWADRDDRINDGPGMAGAPEDSSYSGAGVTYKVKNGKYASVEELLLVAGVGDDLYNQLAPQLTVYGDNKINLCQASDEMIKAFVYKAVQSSAGTIPPIRLEDEDKWKVVVKATRLACNVPSPLPSGVASAIATAIGATGPAGLVNQMTTTNRFFRIEAMGTVQESHVRLTVVIDTGSSNPNMWKTLYFRVD